MSGEREARGSIPYRSRFFHPPDLVCVRLPVLHNKNHFILCYIFFFAVPVYLAEKPQSELRVIAGSNAVNLTCTAMGDPMPIITWRKLDGSKEIDPERYLQYLHL